MTAGSVTEAGPWRGHGPTMTGDWREKIAGTGSVPPQPPVTSQSIQSLLSEHTKSSQQSKLVKNFHCELCESVSKCHTQVGSFFVFILKVNRRGKSSKHINGL